MHDRLLIAHAKAQSRQERIRMSEAALRRSQTAISIGLLSVFAPSRETWLVVFTVIFVSASNLCLLAGEPKPGPATPDSAKIVGPDQCAKCHQAEVQQWMQTPHFATFDSLHRQPRAKEIAAKLGVQSIKRSDICTQCHYTMQNQEGHDRVVAGVSCESCHGGALGWLAIHADFGGAGITRASESPEHRDKRVADAVADGMNNPHNIYLIAR